MDELRGPTVQIVLHLQEGLGFGFLRAPFVVSGSLNGYLLETDPVVPCHGPVFDAELVWEADKRRFRSLRIQNVPIKVEVFTTSTQGRKDKVGYLLISLLAAQPKPANKIVDIKHSWHRLLGVKSEGKCCHPQLLMSLSVEDRVHTATPRNELRLFHSNELATPSARGQDGQPSARTMMLTVKEYIAESNRTATTPDLQPRLLCDEGLIQLGAGRHLFVLSLIVGAVDSLDLLLPKPVTSAKDVSCFVTYSVFTHNISTDRVTATVTGDGVAAIFNQRTSLRLRSSLASLGHYFGECPHLVTRVCADTDIGICSLNLRKLIPTHDIDQFLRQFCNSDGALTIHERCFLLRCDEGETRSATGRRPYVDIEMCLKYLGVNEEHATKPPLLTARSAMQLSVTNIEQTQQQLDCKFGSCTQLDRDVGGVAYTNMAATNTARFKNASGDALIQTTEIAELIKKMYDSFTLSQEKLLLRLHPTTSDMQVQCEPEAMGDGQRTKVPLEVDNEKEAGSEHSKEPTKDIEELPTNVGTQDRGDAIPVKMKTSSSDTCVQYAQRYHLNHHSPKPIDTVKMAIPAEERESIMQKFVEELEDWKEKQQELYKCQLKRKEEYHLEMLAREWAKKREELETKLRGGIEQCRHLAADLSRATDEFRLKGFRNTQREKKLLDAKKALEDHYTAKYQELREASQKMEDDMNHQLKLKNMRIEELELKIMQLEKQVEGLQDKLKGVAREAESKYSGLTKDQTASLIQELRHLEEKLDSATQSKAFFKEQWGRAVRELHVMKLGSRRQMLSQLQRDRRRLGECGLDTIPEPAQIEKRSQMDLNKLKDDFYVELLVDSPALEVESHSTIVEGPTGMDIFDDIKNTKNDKLSELISQRDSLIEQDSPDEDQIKQLNHEIRTMLLNCAT